MEKTLKSIALLSMIIFFNSCTPTSLKEEYKELNQMENCCGEDGDIPPPPPPPPTDD